MQRTCSRSWSRARPATRRRATSRSPTTRTGSTRWSSRAAPTSRPTSYGETPLQPKWSGDRVRDEYERALLAAFAERGKPVLGVCRGLQLINVAFGGTLLQDIGTQRPDARRAPQRRDLRPQRPSVEFVPGTRLAELFEGRRRGERQQRPPPGGQGPRAAASSSRRAARPTA